MMWTSVFLLLSSVVLAWSQGVPIPRQPLGFVYGNGRSNATIQWEAFIDINCPDCQTAFPIFTQVAQHFGPKQIALRVYNFPLPWHTNSFLGVQGSFVTNKLTQGKKTFDWYNTIYEHMDEFDVDRTANMTKEEILDAYAKYAPTVGLSAEQFKSELQSGPSFDQGVEQWRFGAARAVAGTPTFFINGVLSDADETWSYDRWLAFFDKLIGPGDEANNFGCAKDKTPCEYLPGKIMCCTHGEACVRKWGCQC